MRARHPGNIVALMLITLAACSSTPPPPRPQPQLAFLQEPALIAPASEVSFRNQYNAPMLDPNVEHNHGVKPAEIAQSWVGRRLQASSLRHGKLTVTVLDGSVVQEQLPMDKTLKARLLERQAEFKLTGTLKWRVSYTGPILESWTSDGVAMASGTVLEQSSLNDVDQTYADLIDGLARNFDQRMEEQLASLRLAQSDAVDRSGH